MKIRSLLLGSIAAAGIASSGYAADLGVVTSLDVCDELGLSGLTISSDDNCLVITGGVEMEYSIGDYAPAHVIIPDFDRLAGKNWTVIDNNGVTDADLDIDAWLQFVATADSDFGPATATIKLLGEDYHGTGTFTVGIDKAWVGIGDTTMLMAGKKDSIFADGDDTELNYLGLFNSKNVDRGVGFSAGAPTTGGVGIQVVSNLGNGISVGGAVENLQTSSPAIITGVGVISYAGDGVTAHASGAIDQASSWKFHAGFTGAWDPIKVVAAISGNKDAAMVGGMYLNALGSVSATFDMFTLALSGEATNQGEWGVGGSASAAVTDGVTINLGGRYFHDNAVLVNAWQVEAGISAAVTETITLTAAVGATDSNVSAPVVVYGKAGLAWAPGGGFTSSIDGEVNSIGGYKATFKAAKSIK